MAPKRRIDQRLFESAGLAGGFQQAQGRAGQAAAPRQVLPIPPGAGAAAAVVSSSSTSSVRPAVADALETLDKPQGGEVRPVHGPCTHYTAGALRTASSAESVRQPCLCDEYLLTAT